MKKLALTYCHVWLDTTGTEQERNRWRKRSLSVNDMFALLFQEIVIISYIDDIYLNWKGLHFKNKTIGQHRCPCQCRFLGTKRSRSIRPIKCILDKLFMWDLLIILHDMDWRSRRPFWYKGVSPKVWLRDVSIYQGSVLVCAQCNDVSHWLGAYLDWLLIYTFQWLVNLACALPWYVHFNTHSCRFDTLRHLMIYIDGLVQDFNISIASALEILQSYM